MWRSATQAAIRAALLDAGTKPRDVAGLQLHGTGTGLGDPIEAGSAAALFQQRKDPDRAGPPPPGDFTSCSERGCVF
jgi:acyl transferase domain-containing protein